MLRSTASGNRCAASCSGPNSRNAARACATACSRVGWTRQQLHVAPNVRRQAMGAGLRRCQRRDRPGRAMLPCWTLALRTHTCGDARSMRRAEAARLRHAALLGLPVTVANVRRRHPQVHRRRRCSGNLRRRAPRRSPAVLMAGSMLSRCIPRGRRAAHVYLGGGALCTLRFGEKWPVARSVLSNPAVINRSEIHVCRASVHLDMGRHECHARHDSRVSPSPHGPAAGHSPNHRRSTVTLMHSSFAHQVSFATVESRT